MRAMLTECKQNIDHYEVRFLMSMAKDVRHFFGLYSIKERVTFLNSVSILYPTCGMPTVVLSKSFVANYMYVLAGSMFSTS